MSLIRGSAVRGYCMSEADPASGASFACCSSLCSMYCAVLYAARRLLLRYVPCTAQSFCTIHNVCIRVEVKCKPHSPLPLVEVPSKAGLPSVLEARHRLSLELFLLERAASSEYTVAIDDCMQRHRLQCVCVRVCVCVCTVVIVSACSVYIDSAVTSLITGRRWALQQT